MKNDVSINLLISLTLETSKRRSNFSSTAPYRDLHYLSRTQHELQLGDQKKVKVDFTRLDIFQVIRARVCGCDPYEEKLIMSFNVKKRKRKLDGSAA